MACQGTSAILKEANSLDLFRTQFRWLLLEGSKLSDTDMLLGLNLLLDSDVVVGRRVSENRFRLMEVYKRGTREGLVWGETGTWQLDAAGVEPTSSHILSVRRTNIHKSVLKAVMVVTNNDTLNHLSDTINKHIDTITKVNDVLFHHIVDVLNASVETTVVDTWGYPDSAGNWSGLTGYLQRSEADIGATGMFVTKERIPFVRYIASTSVTRNAFIFRQPPLSFVTNIFTLPFSRSVWLASAALIAVAGASLYFALKCEKRRDEVTGSDITLLSLGAVCQQGTTVEAESMPGRIVLFVLFTTVIFLYTAYSACIVALLQSSTDAIRTLKDLLNSGLTLGVEDVVYNRHYFPAASDPIRRAIYNKVGADRFMSLEEGVEKLRKGLFAFHMELGPGYELISDTFLDEEKCGLQTINFLIEIVEPWVGVSKTTPLTEILSVAYRKVKEFGLQHRENSRFYQTKPKCVTRGSMFVSVGLVDCYAALLMLACGLLFSGAVLLMEFLTMTLHSYKNSVVTFDDREEHLVRDTDVSLRPDQLGPAPPNRYHGSSDRSVKLITPI
ncbi:probable glutamate receptor isoform X2 [Zootermopsis nevadensis]|nr:probable glutamate receptor isoform X2 [Zootermopsis nevadensis]